MLPCTVQALVSASDTTSGCHASVLQLSRISSYCGLSYLSLVTTYDVEAVASTVFGGSTFSLLCIWSAVNLFQCLLNTAYTTFFNPCQLPRK
jgi:hypothetical protein